MFKYGEKPLISYSTGLILGEEDLDKTVQHLHQSNCKANRWKYKPLAPVMYGYDILVAF